MISRAGKIAALCAGLSIAAPTPLAAAESAELQALVAAYPDFLDSIDGNELVWRDGARMTIDDGIADKSPDQLLNTPDLDDQFAYPYPRALPAQAPPVNADPGRIRHEPFFVKMYGDCKKGEVDAKLKRIVWLQRKYGRAVLVTSVNGVAEKLDAVSRELDRLPAEFDKFLFPLAGIYNCRSIAGTGRKSVHAFAAAIDLNVKQADYWRWSKPDASGRYPYRNRIPPQIVEVFERHGFIWGGRWYHYDTMHFEYRPELIALSKSK